MPRKVRTVVPLVLIVALSLVLAPAGQLRSQEDVQRVFITNFPQTQQVAGTDAIDGVVRHATLQRLKDLVEAPVGPKETTRLVPPGALTAEGLTPGDLS